MKQIISIVTLLLACQMSYGGTWLMGTDLYCPYNCTPRSKNPGYVIEILERAASRSRDTLDYKLVPFSRALKETRAGLMTGTPLVIREQEAGLLLSQRVGYDIYVFLVKKGDPFIYKSPADLNRLKSVGTVQGYEYGEVFTRWAKLNPGKVQVTTSDRPVDFNLKKLRNGRIQAMLVNPFTAKYNDDAIRDLSDLSIAGVFEKYELYIAFSAKNPNSVKYVDAVNKTLYDMKHSGDFNNLLLKYGIKY